MSEGPYKPTGYEAPGTHAVECPDGHVIYTDKARYWAGELNAAYRAGKTSGALDAMERRWDAAGAASRPAPDVDAIAREAAERVSRIGPRQADSFVDAAAAVIREAIERARNPAP
jgi:hypothetical protein